MKQHQWFIAILACVFNHAVPAASDDLPVPLHEIRAGMDRQSLIAIFKREPDQQSCAKFASTSFERCHLVWVFSKMGGVMGVKTYTVTTALGRVISFSLDEKSGVF